MRTTVTLEPDVARLLSEHARQTRKSFKETLNAAVRSSLGRVRDASENRDFTIKARPMQLKAGVDSGRFNALLDDLDADAFIEKTLQITIKNHPNDCSGCQHAGLCL